MTINLLGIYNGFHNKHCIEIAKGGIKCISRIGLNVTLARRRQMDYGSEVL